MPEPEPRSLLGDILAASSRQAPAPTPAAIPVRSRNELEDLLRLGDADWRRFLGEIGSDDLLVVCSAIAPAWRDRVLASLDDDSRTWLRTNLAALDAIAPALLGEARSRAMGAARRLLREGAISLPAAAMSAAPVAPSAAAPVEPATVSPPPAAVARGTVAVSFVPPGAPQSVAPTPPAAVADRPAIGAVSLSFGDMPASAPAAPAVPARPADADEGLDGLFADLARLRDQAGAAALAPLAADVADPFLKSGLCLVAAGMPAAELERALDVVLARQAEAYIDHLTGLRARLLALASGS